MRFAAQVREDLDPIYTGHVDIQADESRRKTASEHRHRRAGPIGDPGLKSQDVQHLTQSICRSAVIVDDQRFGQLVLQNDIAHDRHIIAWQLCDRITKAAIVEKSEKRLKQVVCHKLLGNDQVVPLLK